MVTKKFTAVNWREYSPWLALAVSMVLVGGSLSLTLLWPRPGLSADRELSAGVISAGGDYQSPQRCRECHAEEYQMWANTTHARALFDPIFQTYLQQIQKPGECFACHATGYDTTTGQFVLAGVTCEACHGPYRAGHPQESMAIITSADMCGSCHPSTLHEWQSSRHGAVGVTCINCHQVHSQRTLAAVSTSQLCAACHQDNIQNDTHATHMQAQIHCVDCHLARPEDDGGGAVNGRAVTGHSFEVFVKTCTDCHAASISGVSPF